MASLDELMSQIPMNDVAAKLGVDEQTARAAVEQALPALVGGLEANAKDPGGAASIEKAVTKHSPALVDGGVRLDEVDTNDGEKIVSHIFGPNKEQVVATLGAQPAAVSGKGLGPVIGKLLPILAPIVLSYLAKKFQERKPTTETAQPTEPMQPKSPKKEPEQGLGGVLSDLLGGGGSTGGSSRSTSGGIGDILGDLLGGGGSKGGGSGGIGDLLGGLLGGGRR
ncbi:DUF937 domain-containing protein [Mycetocola sp.]|uniref:DUF937 domain-containing protein n=1 Tax=Mycetocola sp. TaxID=1871042 RepID=UPI003988F31E